MREGMLWFAELGWTERSTSRTVLQEGQGPVALKVRRVRKPPQDGHGKVSCTAESNIGVNTSSGNPNKVGPGELFDEFFHLELEESGVDLGGWEAGGINDFVDLAFLGVEVGEEAGFGVAEVGSGGGFWIGWSLGVWGEGEEGEVVEDLGAVGDEGGALADEGIASVGGGTIDGAGDGVNLPAVVAGEVGGDEGAGAGGAFDDEESAAPTGDDAVALREGLLVGGGVEGELADDRAVSVGDEFGEGACFQRDRPGRGLIRGRRRCGLWRRRRLRGRQYRCRGRGREMTV